MKEIILGLQIWQGSTVKFVVRFLFCCGVALCLLVTGKGGTLRWNGHMKLKQFDVVFVLVGSVRNNLYAKETLLCDVIADVYFR